MNEKPADESRLMPWLVFRAGTHLCAVAVDQVIEIMRTLPIQQLSGAPHYVRGVCIVRGAPLAVVDLGALIGAHVTRPERLVAVRVGPRSVALAVETVIGVRSISAGERVQLPPLLRDAARETVAAIGTLDTELLLFLRTSRIVPEDLLRRLDVRETAG